MLRLHELRGESGGGNRNCKIFPTSIICNIAQVNTIKATFGIDSRFRAVIMLEMSIDTVL